MLLFWCHVHDQFAFPRAVEFDEHDALPGAEDELAMLEGKHDRCSDEGRENVIGHVLRVVGMTVAELGNHGFEGIKHVEVGAGIQIGGGQRGGGVEYEQVAYSCGLRMIFLEQGFDGFGDVEDFAFLAGFDG